MREIKFRAWDRGKMTYNPLAYDEWTTEIQPLNPVIDSIQKDKEQVLMQYTGLKDKNGKEIYEGDILSNEHNVKWFIQWDDDEARFRNALFLKNREVIGNIYENPDLLN